jgi:hypothetical protein
MDPDNVPLPIRRGISLVTAWQFLNANNQPLDLTGYSAQLDVRDPRLNTLWLHLSSDAGGGLVITPLTGLVSVAALPALTAAIPATGAGAWDLVLIAPDTNRYRYIGGPAPVSDPVTLVA